jgi:adenylate cyclase class 2
MLSKPVKCQISNFKCSFLVLRRCPTQILDIIMKSKSNNETEIKLRVTDVSALRRRLQQLKARQISPRTHEFNTLYDTPKKNLSRRGQLIRVRVEQPASAASQKRHAAPTEAKLTYKGPAQAKSNKPLALDRPKKKGRYKVREECEVTMSDGKQMRRILTALGLRPSFRYEKFRTTFALQGQRNLKLEFDETPIGTFLELEGSPSAINRVARLLGYAYSQYITQTYGALYIADSRRHGSKPSDMLFSTTKKSR